MPGVRPPWGGGASGWATPSSVTAQSIVVYGGGPCGRDTSHAGFSGRCLLSLAGVCVGTRTSVWLRVCEPLAPGVFTPQSYIHVSCPPCARARRVECVCLHLLCNYVCLCSSRARA